MAITQTLCTSFKQQILLGQQDFSPTTTKTYKIALYTSIASLDASTTTYTGTSGEVPNGAGYITGGNTLTISVTPTTSGTTAYLSFSNTSWSAASFTARGALIYNSTDDTAVAVLDFGTDKTSSGGSFQVIFPTADATNAIIRIE